MLLRPIVLWFIDAHVNLQNIVENPLYYAIQTWNDEILSEGKMAADNFLELRIVMKFTKELLCNVVCTWCCYKMSFFEFLVKIVVFHAMKKDFENYRRNYC